MIRHLIPLFCAILPCWLSAAAIDQIVEEDIIIISALEKHDVPVATVRISNPANGSVQMPIGSEEMLVSLAERASRLSRCFWAWDMDEYERRVWLYDKRIVMVDSDSGDVPLYVTPVYDSNGLPVPRLPDPFSRKVHETKDPRYAKLWIDGRVARIRSLKETEHVIRKSAIDNENIKPEDFQMDQNLRDDASAVQGYIPKVGKDDKPLSKPILDYEAAMANGFSADSIPHAPLHMSEFEVWVLWDDRKMVSIDAIPDFVGFATSLIDAGATITARTIDINDSKERWTATLEFIESFKVPAGETRKRPRRIENYPDVTNLRTTLSIAVVPTYFFIDRRLGRIYRINGAQTEVQLQDHMKQFMGLAKDTAWPLSPQLFMNSNDRDIFIKKNRDRLEVISPMHQVDISGPSEKADPPSKPEIPWSK